MEKKVKCQNREASHDSLILIMKTQPELEKSASVKLRWQLSARSCQKEKARKSRRRGLVIYRASDMAPRVWSLTG